MSTDNNNNADKNIEGILDPLGTVIYGIWIHDLWDAGVALYQLSQQADWEMNFSKALFSLLLKKSSQLRGLPLYSFLQLQAHIWFSYIYSHVIMLMIYTGKYFFIQLILITNDEHQNPLTHWSKN